MKIAVFIPSLAGGGAERVAVTLVNEFTQLGHDTHLLVATKAPAAYKDEVSKDVSLHLFSASRTLFCLSSLAKFIKTQKPTILLAVMDHASLVAYAALILAGRKNKTRFFVREAVSLEYKKAQFTGITGAIKRTRKELMIRHVYRAANGVIAPSIDLTNSLRQRYGPKITVTHIDNPVVTRQFKEMSCKSAVELPWQQHHKTIVSAGRFTAQKDFLTLLRAFKILRNTVDCKLILLGEGAEQEKLESYIEQNKLKNDCYLPGFVKNPLPFFKEADVFVLSSKFEGSPNVLIQALACGTAVVSTDCPTGPKEILVDDSYGVLVPVGNEKDMASAIKLKLGKANNGEQRRVAKAVNSKYDSTSIAKQYLSLLNSNLT